MKLHLSLLVSALLATTAVQAQTTPAAKPAAATSTTAPAAARELSALVVADNEATLSAQMPGRINRINFAIGQAFKAGATLAEFDCAEQNAKLESLNAEYLGARETHLAKLKLQGLGAAGELEVTLAAAAAEKAKSQVKQQQAAMAACRISAPYAGKIVRLKAKQAESVAVNQPVLEIVASNKIKSIVHVPSAWAARLQAGQTFGIRFAEGGNEYQAKVARLNARIDGVSQTLEVEATFTGSTDGLIPGMIGQANFPDSVKGK